MNILYANAGQKICDDVQHLISIAEVRGNHKGGERVKDSIIKLMTTVVHVPVVDKRGKPATRRVQLLSDNTSTDDENDPAGQIVYSFSPGHARNHQELRPCGAGCALRSCSPSRRNTR